MSYISQEFKRVLLKKKISLIIIFVFIIILGFVSVSRTQTYEEQLNQSKGTLYNFKTMDKAETVKTGISRYSKDIAENEKLIEDLESKLDKINNYDKTKLDAKIIELEKQNDRKNEYEINQLKYDKQYNIETYNLVPKGIYKSFDMLASFFPVLFLFILIILLSDIVSGENDPNTIKLLVTKSISRTRIIISKFVVSIFLSVSIIILSAITFILEAGIHLGFSDYKLPFDIGSRYVLDTAIPLTTISSQMSYVSQSRHFLPIWSAFIILLLILLISSVSIISIIMIISTISKNPLISVVTNLILIVGSGAWCFLKLTSGYLIAAQYGVVCKLLPITYMIDNIDVLSGDISVRLNNSISIFFALMVCLFWILIMMSLSTYIFAKRDFD